MAFHFGIRPWEIDELAPNEVSTFMRALSEIEINEPRG